MYIFKSTITCYTYLIFLPAWLKLSILIIIFFASYRRFDLVIVTLLNTVLLRPSDWFHGVGRVDALVYPTEETEC
jgi:hypothetical protein